MELTKSLTYMFEDEKWVNKVVVGAVINLIPILNFASPGYTLATMRNIANDIHPPLPTWDEFGNHFIKGLILTIIGAIYALPLIILSCCPLTTVFLPGLGKTDETTNVLGIFYLAIAVIFALLALLYTLAYTFVMPAVILNYASAEDFSAAFQFGKIFNFIRDNIDEYFKAWLYILVVGIVIGFAAFVIGIVVGWIPICGWLITWILELGVGFWAYLVVAHVYGQFAREVELPLRPASAVA